MVPKCPEAQAGLLRTAATAAACSTRSGAAVAKSRRPSRLRTRLSRHPPPTRKDVAILVQGSTSWLGRGHSPLRRVDWEGTPHTGTSRSSAALAVHSRAWSRTFKHCVLIGEYRDVNDAQERTAAAALSEPTGCIPAPRTAPPSGSPQAARQPFRTPVPAARRARLCAPRPGARGRLAEVERHIDSARLGRIQCLRGGRLAAEHTDADNTPPLPGGVPWPALGPWDAGER